MRTTLTLEDDLVRLKEVARSTDRNLEDVVNDAIRKGLSVGDAGPAGPDPFVARPQACGFRTGIDPTIRHSSHCFNPQRS